MTCPIIHPSLTIFRAYLLSLNRAVFRLFDRLCNPSIPYTHARRHASMRPFCSPIHAPCMCHLFTPSKHWEVCNRPCMHECLCIQVLAQPSIMHLPAQACVPLTQSSDHSLTLFHSCIQASVIPSSTNSHACVYAFIYSPFHLSSSSYHLCMHPLVHPSTCASKRFHASVLPSIHSSIHLPSIHPSTIHPSNQYHVLSTLSPPIIH